MRRPVPSRSTTSQRPIDPSTCHIKSPPVSRDFLVDTSSRDIHRTTLRAGLRSVSKPAMAFIWVCERPRSMVGGAVSAAGSFLAGLGGGQSPHTRIRRWLPMPNDISFQSAAGRSGFPCGRSANFKPIAHKQHTVRNVT